ncbi:MAG: hypothetical protein U9R08_01080 [Nanoarchaeota archaeon]|nr:hypothetical protein [Nanoarchaeota archaeon]
MELIKGKEYKTKKENKIYTGYYTGIETTNGFLFELSDDPSKG